MPSFLDNSQNALIISLIVVPAIAAALTQRIEKIRSLVEFISSKVATIDKYFEAVKIGKAKIDYALSHLNKLVEDGKIDEAEVKDILTAIEEARKILD